MQCGGSVLGGECILFYSPCAVLCCAVLLRRVQLWSDTLISQCCSPAAQSSRAGNEPSRRLKFHNHGEVLSMDNTFLNHWQPNFMSTYQVSS